jgi:hypothetical protein
MCTRTKLISIEEFRELNRKAADLYFGSEWSRGLFKPSTAYRFDNPQCASGDISNANAIIIRIFTDATLSEDRRVTQRTLGVALAYATALSSGDHYQSVVNLCDQLIPSVPLEEELSDQLAKIKSVFGKCLRMTQANIRAHTILSEIADYPLPTSTRQSTLLNLALIYQGQCDDEQARNYSQKVISIDRHSHLALQAQTILIELEPESPKKAEKLAAHENKCRRLKAVTAANNIALSRARSSDADERRKILEPVMLISRGTADHYNQTRAVIELSKLALGEGRPLTEKELSQLINAYHFLFSERIAPVFDRCHDALWSGFQAIDDDENLLNLFRHSSLYWRLRGKSGPELKYMKLLAKRVANLEGQQDSRELSYFRARAQAVGLLEGKKKALELTSG